jgi:septal ring-binding cell division protein DamX
MASGGKRTASERVLESKHVIGLFLLMLLFSGVFFTLGYVMGRNQYDAQVSAASSFASRPVIAKSDPTPKKNAEPPSTAAESDPATSNSDWEFYGNNKPPKSEPRLEAAAKPPVAPALAKPLNGNAKAQPQPASAPAKGSKQVASGPPIPPGAYVLQVAAFLKQDDAVTVANNLQRKHFLCYIQTPQKDKYYRVQVGPFKDRKAADAAKQGLENEGFNAFYIKH